MKRKRRQKGKRSIATKKQVESMSKGWVSLKKEGEKEGKSFAKLKFTIMVVRQRDSEAGQVDKGKGTP